MSKLRQSSKEKNTVGRIAKRVRPKTIKYLRKLAWNLLSQIIRMSGADHAGNATCYTCDKYDHWKNLQAGHAIGGRHNAVLLDEELLRIQCVHCNIFLRGNYPVFIAKLVREHGIDWWERKLEVSKQLKLYTRTDLEEKIEGYRSRLNKLRGVNHDDGDEEG